MPNDDVGRDGKSAGFTQRTNGIGELFRIHLAPGLALPIVNVGFESEEKRLKTGAHHEACDLGRDETGIEGIGRVERDMKILSPHGIEERKENAVGLE